MPRRTFREDADKQVQLPASSRGVLLSIFVVSLLVGSAAYAGPSVGIVLYHLLTDGGILLLWLAAALGAGIYLLWLLRCDSAVGVLRWVTAGALGLGVFSLVALGLGLAGWLNAGTAWLMLAIGVVLGIVRIVRSDTPETRERLAAWFAAPAGSAWLLLLTLPFAIPTVVGAMLPPGLLWSPDEPHGYDVVEYHLQVPREWYEGGRIVPLHHNVFSYFPFNVEMHYLLAMHLRGGPWAGMYLAQLMHGAFIFLSALAVYGIARALTNRRLSAVLATLAVATVPWLAQLGAIAYDEGGLLLWGTLAFGWAMRATFEPERRLSRFVLAGIMAGLACGTKLTAVPEVLIPIAVASAIFAIRSIIKRGEVSAPRLIGEIVLFGFIGLLVFSPWLLRNVAWARNPVFPEAANLLGRDGFSDVQVERWNHAHAATPAEQSLAGHVRALGDQVLASWQFGYVLLPLSIIAFFMSLRDPKAWYWMMILAMLVIFWLGFTHLQGRFLVLAIPVAGVLIAQIDLDRVRLTGRFVRVAIQVVIISAAIVSASLLNDDLLLRLYGAMPLASILGTEDLGMMVPDEFQHLPRDSTVILVGDARAFLFTIPMSRLRYRTVFDADTSNGRGVVEAWAGPDSARRGAWLWIAPRELSRFNETYQPFPPLPAWIESRHEPFLIKGQ